MALIMDENGNWHDDSPTAEIDSDDALRRQHEEYEELERAWRHQTRLQIVPVEQENDRRPSITPQDIDDILERIDRPSSKTPYLH